MKRMYTTNSGSGKCYRLLLLFTIFGFQKLATAQDVHFSNYNLLPLYQNPAHAGIEYDLRVGVANRQQWKNIQEGFTTTAISFDTRKFSKERSGRLALGVLAYSDKAGSSGFKTTHADMNFAYRFSIDRKQVVSAGLMFGFQQRSISQSDLQWASQYDGITYNGTLPTGENFSAIKQSYFDAGFGIAWHYSEMENNVELLSGNKLTIGFAMFHPHEPGENFISQNILRRKFVFHGNGAFLFNDRPFEFMPSFQYVLQGKQQELIAGGMINYILKTGSKYTGLESKTTIGLGGYYRIRDAIVLSFLLQTSRFSFFLSSDLTTSDLSNGIKRTGSSELGIGYFFQGKRRLT